MTADRAEAPAARVDGVVVSGNVMTFYNPDCPNCRDWPEINRSSCACCAPELMAACEATQADVDEAAKSTSDADAFKRDWQMDARKRVAVGAIVRFRRHTPRFPAPQPILKGGGR